MLTSSLVTGALLHWTAVQRFITGQMKEPVTIGCSTLHGTSIVTLQSSGNNAEEKAEEDVRAKGKGEMLGNAVFCT